mgnify:CR=1 FL=1
MSKPKLVSQRGPVTPIKLTRGQAVRVNCPRPDKYPSFARSFHRRKGTVLVIEPYGASDVIVVDVSTRAEPGQYINITRSWLSHDRRAA